MCRAELTAAQVFGIDDLAPPKSSGAAIVNLYDDSESSEAEAVPMESDSSLFDGLDRLSSSTKFDAVVKQLQDSRR